MLETGTIAYMKIHSMHFRENSLDIFAGSCLHLQLNTRMMAKNELLRSTLFKPLI